MDRKFEESRISCSLLNQWFTVMAIRLNNEGCWIILWMMMENEYYHKTLGKKGVAPVYTVFVDGNLSVVLCMN